jgi:hypothetical protein
MGQAFSTVFKEATIIELPVLVYDYTDQQDVDISFLTKEERIGGSPKPGDKIVEFVGQSDPTKFVFSQVNKIFKL